MRRRRLLGALSAAASAGLAGCSGFGLPSDVRENYDVPSTATTDDDPDSGPDPGGALAGRPVERPATLARRVTTEVAGRRRLVLTGGGLGGGRAPRGTRFVAGFLGTATAESPARLWVAVTNPGEDPVTVTMGPRPPFSGVVGRLTGDQLVDAPPGAGPGDPGTDTPRNATAGDGTTTTGTGEGTAGTTVKTTPPTTTATTAIEATGTPTTTTTTATTVKTTPEPNPTTADGDGEGEDDGDGDGGGEGGPPGAIPFEEVGALLLPVAGRGVDPEAYAAAVPDRPGAGEADRNCWQATGPVPLGEGERQVELGPGESVVAEYVLVGPQGPRCLPDRGQVRFLSGSEPTTLGLATWPVGAERPPASRFPADRAPPELPDHERVRWFHRLGFDPGEGPIHPVSDLVEAGDGFGTGTGEGTGTGGPVLAPAYLVPERERLSLPGRARVTLRNYSRTTLGINPADFDLYKLRNGTWHFVAPRSVNLPGASVPPGGTWPFDLRLAGPTAREGVGPDGGRRVARTVAGLGGGAYALRFGRVPARGLDAGPLVADGPDVERRGDPGRIPTAAPAVLLSVEGPPVRFGFGPRVVEVTRSGRTVRVELESAGTSGLDAALVVEPRPVTGDEVRDGDDPGGDDSATDRDPPGCGVGDAADVVAEQATQVPALRNGLAGLAVDDAPVDRAVVVASPAVAGGPFRYFCGRDVTEGTRFEFALRGRRYVARFRRPPP